MVIWNDISTTTNPFPLVTEADSGYQPSDGEHVIMEAGGLVQLPEPAPGKVVAVSVVDEGEDVVIDPVDGTVEGNSSLTGPPSGRQVFYATENTWLAESIDPDLWGVESPLDWDAPLIWGDPSGEVEWIEEYAIAPEPWLDDVTEWYEWENNIRAKFHVGWDEAPDPANGGLRISTRGESIGSSEFRGVTLAEDLSEFDDLFLDLFFYETSGGARDREARILIDGDEVFYDQSGESGDLGDHIWSNDWEYHEWEIDISQYTGSTEIDFQLRDEDGTSADSPTFAISNIEAQ